MAQRLFAPLFLVCCLTLATSPTRSQTPEKPTVVKPGEYFEIVSAAPEKSLVDFTVLDPPDLKFSIHESGRVFCSSGLSKSGFVRVLEIALSPDSSSKIIKTFHVFSVGPPPSPTPVILPTAKLTVDPSSLLTTDLKPVTLTWEGAPEGATATLNTGDGPKDVDLNGNAVVLPQRTSLYTLAVSFEGHIAYSQAIVTVSDKPPPDPIPPGPILETGLRVLITYDNPTKHQLPRSLLAALDSPTLRSYLDSVVAKDNGQPGKRFWHKDLTVGDDQPAMKKLMAIQKATSTTPWIVISPARGTVGFSGPLPADEDSIINLVKKYQ